MAADSSGNSRDGILVNMENEDWQPGKLNNCLRFDGINEYVNLGDIAGFERTDPFSLECWFKSGVADGFFISKFYGLAYRGWSLYLANGKIYFMLANSQSNRAFCGTVNSFDDGQWHHLIATYNGSSDINNARIYVDSISQSRTINENGLTSTIQNERNCYLGVRDVVDYYFNGRIDEAVIYDKELSQAEVTLRWNSGNGIEEMLSEDYPTDKPTIRPVDSWQSLGLIQLTAFNETLGGGNQGSIGYQLSGDNGMNWLFWNGASWAIAGDDDYNDALTIQTNIESFLIDSDKIVFKAFLISDGTQQVELDKIKITAKKLSDILQIIVGKVTNIKIEADKIQPEILDKKDEFMADISGLAPASEYDIYLAAIKAETDKINFLKTMIELIEQVEIGEWIIGEDVLFFLDADQNTIASFQLHYDNKGNVIRRERIS